MNYIPQDDSRIIEELTLKLTEKLKNIPLFSKLRKHDNDALLDLSIQIMNIDESGFKYK